MRMRCKRWSWAAVVLSFALLVGCAAPSAGGQAAVPPDGMQESSDLDTASMEVNALPESGELFSDADREIGYEESTTAVIALDDGGSSCDSDSVLISGSTVTIGEGGTYLLRGSLSDGQIIVSADEKDNIHLILDGASVQCSGSAALYVAEADKVVVTLVKDTENSLGASGTFAASDEANIDAAVFSRADLTFNGEGSLTVSCDTGHGIVSKDDLVVISGQYAVTASGHALSGKDSVRIAGGDFALAAGTDGIHAENADDPSLGYLCITDGSFSIQSASDGLDAASALEIRGGSLTIAAGDDGIHSDGDLILSGGVTGITESVEGIEGMRVAVSGGEITLFASDDGVNAASPDASGDTMRTVSDCWIKISGGRLEIDATGDGIDSNGDLLVTGGETYIAGPVSGGESALDYSGSAVITGGVFAAAGSSGMAMNFGASSTQAAFLVTVTQGFSGGTVTVTDASGTELLGWSCEKSFDSLLFSCPELTVGETCTVTVGDQSLSVELTDTITGSGGMGGFGGGQRGDRGVRPGEMPEDPSRGMDGERTPRQWDEDGEMPGTPPDGTAPRDMEAWKEG